MFLPKVAGHGVSVGGEGCLCWEGGGHVVVVTHVVITGTQGPIVTTLIMIKVCISKKK